MKNKMEKRRDIVIRSSGLVSWRRQAFIGNLINIQTNECNSGKAQETIRLKERGSMAQFRWREFKKTFLMKLLLN